ncbi:unnamed protein product [Strongylus vulgaris]|uniref:Uncharacterized protein n=1 Tax=Strongylus vulgaris TaxID=40348 RepID=A0A3P7JJJ5_STRVU|nr:unnamed protein product [Strongylus vulgaris]
MLAKAATRSSQFDNSVVGSTQMPMREPPTGVENARSSIENAEKEILPLPIPEQADRFTSGDEVLTKITHGHKPDIEKTPNPLNVESLKSSKWSGYGGASSTSGKPGSEYLGAFGGSHGESTTVSGTSTPQSSQSNLRIYQKARPEKDELLSVAYPGPQGLVADNCPLKCEPCLCPTGKGSERRRRNANNVELSVPLGACNAKRDRKVRKSSVGVFNATLTTFPSKVQELKATIQIHLSWSLTLLGYFFYWPSVKRMKQTQAFAAKL